MILNFVPVLWRDHTHHQHALAILIFMAAKLSMKTVKYCTMRKFPFYKAIFCFLGPTNPAFREIFASFEVRSQVQSSSDQRRCFIINLGCGQLIIDLQTNLFGQPEKQNIRLKWPNVGHRFKAMHVRLQLLPSINC